MARHTFIPLTDNEQVLFRALMTQYINGTLNDTTALVALLKKLGMRFIKQ